MVPETPVPSARRSNESVAVLTARASLVVDELNALVSMLADIALYAAYEDDEGILDGRG